MKSILKAAALFFTLFSSLRAEVIHIEGSSTIFPIMKEMDSNYFDKNGIKLSMNGGSSNEGVECLLEQRCQIGMVARALSDKERKEGVEAHLIGYDAMAIIVNKNNPISSISAKRLLEIYSGKIDNWKELTGDNHEILLIAKKEERSARVLFDEYFNIQKLSEKTEYAGSNIENILMVALERYAICYVSASTAEHAIKSGADIKMLPLEGIVPIQDGKINGSYPFLYPLNLTTHGEYGAEVQKILSMMTSGIGRQFTLNHIILPVEEVPSAK